MDAKTILRYWQEKDVANNTKFDNSKLSEIAVTCISLCNAWFSNAKNGMSFKLILTKKDATDDTILDGVTSETLPLELFGVLTTKNDLYNSASLVGYTVGNNKEMSSQRLGIINIS